MVKKQKNKTKTKKPVVKQPAKPKEMKPTIPKETKKEEPKVQPQAVPQVSEPVAAQPVQAPKIDSPIMESKNLAELKPVQPPANLVSVNAPVPKANTEPEIVSIYPTKLGSISQPLQSKPSDQILQKKAKGFKYDDSAPSSASDFVFKPLSVWSDYIKTDAGGCYKGLMKIKLTQIFAVISLVVLLAIIIGIVGAALYAAGLMKPANTLLLVLVGLPVLFIFIFVISWVSQVIELTSIFFVRSRFTGERFSIAETFADIKFKVLSIWIVNAAIESLLMLPALIIVLIAVGAAYGSVLTAASSSSAPEASSLLLLLTMGVLLYVFLIMYSVIVVLVYRFISQFWAFNYLFSSAKLFDSLKQSVNMVKQKALETAAFDIIAGVIAMFFGIPLMFYTFFAGQVAIPALLIMGATMKFDLAAWLIFGFFFLLHIIIVLLLFVLIEIFRVPVSYLYWRQVKSLGKH